MEAKTHQKTIKKNRIREGARKETEGRMGQRQLKEADGRGNGRERIGGGVMRGCGCVWAWKKGAVCMCF